MKTSSQRPSSADAIAVIERPDPIDHDDFALIYRHYKPTVMNYARLRGAGDPEGIADLALLSGFKAINNLDTRTQDTFGYYLNRAVLGHIADEQRANSRNPGLELRENADLPDELLDDPTDQLVDAAWLHDLVDRLPADQRDVIEHRFFADLSGTETGHELGKDPNAVYQLQHRAIRSLRRTLIAGLLVALAVVAGIVALRAVGSNVTVDSSPVNRTEEPVPTEAQITSTTAHPPSQLDDNRSSEREADNSIGVIAGTDTTQPDTAAGSTDGTEQEPSDALPGTTVLPEATPAVTTDVTTPPVEQTPAATAAPPLPSTPLNVCYPHLISLDELAVSLFNPESDHGRAANFRPPSAVRFLDAAGTELHRINTSGPMTTGLSYNSHGWMGDGTGTYALFVEAPTPTLWGVLVDPAIAGGWATIQAQDSATNQWQTVPGCA